VLARFTFSLRSVNIACDSGSSKRTSYSKAKEPVGVKVVHFEGEYFRTNIGKGYGASFLRHDNMLIIIMHSEPFNISTSWRWSGEIETIFLVTRLEGFRLDSHMNKTCLWSCSSSLAF
jgi:hypothetical protein